MFLFENGFHAVLQYYLIPNLLFYYHLHSAPFIHYPQWCFNNFTCLIAGLLARLCNTSSWRDISSHGTYLGKESHTFLPYVTCLCHPDRYSSFKWKALKRPNVKIKWLGIHFMCYPCTVLTLSIFSWIMLQTDGFPCAAAEPFAERQQREWGGDRTGEKGAWATNWI